MNTAEYIVITLILCVLIILIYTGSYLKHETSRCITNPFTYSIEKLSQHFGKDISCFCSNGISLNKTDVSGKIISGG